MALISARTIVTSLSLFHMTLGFFFLTNPVSVADQALVYVLGEALGIPHARAFDAPSPGLAFLGVVLATFGITDLVTLSLPDEVCLVHYWGTQAPVRVLLATLGVALSFWRRKGSPRNLYAYALDGGLQNRVFFAFVLLESLSWCWLWATLREERVQLLAHKASRRRSQVYN